MTESNYCITLYKYRASFAPFYLKNSLLPLGWYSALDTVWFIVNPTHLKESDKSMMDEIFGFHSLQRGAICQALKGLTIYKEALK